MILKGKFENRGFSSILFGMEVKKSNHCAYQTHYHIVFPVKYRKALVVSGVEKEILKIADEISERYEIEFEEIGCDKKPYSYSLFFPSSKKMLFLRKIRYYSAPNSAELGLS